jgi:fucose permease
MEKILLTGAFLLSALLIITGNGFTQEKENDKLLSSATFSGLEFRSIGPAFMSGRIADIAIHPDKPATWYVAVGSGGAVLTGIQGLVSDASGSIKIAFLVPMFCFQVIMAYSVYTLRGSRMAVA